MLLANFRYGFHHLLLSRYIQVFLYMRLSDDQLVNYQLMKGNCQFTQIDLMQIEIEPSKLISITSNLKIGIQHKQLQSSRYCFITIHSQSSKHRYSPICIKNKQPINALVSVVSHGVFKHLYSPSSFDILMSKQQPPAKNRCENCSVSVHQIKLNFGTGCGKLDDIM